jgi:hypothetical protein
MADGTLKVGEITNSAGSGNITIGSGVTVNVNRPAFMAYQGSDLNVSDDTVTKVPIDTEIFDTDSAFDTSNYRFTIPTGGDGKYFFHGSVCPEDYSAHTMYYCQIELHKNGTKVKQNFFNTKDGSTNIGFFPLILSYEDDAVAGDYYELFGLSGGATAARFDAGSSTEKRGIFGGYKLIGA